MNNMLLLHVTNMHVGIDWNILWIYDINLVSHYSVKRLYFSYIVALNIFSMCPGASTNSLVHVIYIITEVKRHSLDHI